MRRRGACYRKEHADIALVRLDGSCAVQRYARVCYEHDRRYTEHIVWRLTVFSLVLGYGLLNTTESLV